MTIKQDQVNHNGTTNTTKERAVEENNFYNLNNVVFVVSSWFDLKR